MGFYVVRLYFVALCLEAKCAGHAAHPSSVLDDTLPLLPTIRTHGRASVHLNFGQERFAYDVRAHISTSTQMEVTRSRIILPFEIIMFVMNWIIAFSTQKTSGIKFSAEMIFWQRALGSMRLTCRFWGEFLREYLFLNVTIISSASYHRFAQLLASDKSIADMVRSVELRDTSPLPWSHQVFLSTALNKLSKVEHLSLCGSHLVPAQTQLEARPPSLRGAGVCALINHTFSGIKTLQVNGLALASFRHVRDLLKGLPELWQFDAQALGWPQMQTRYETLKLDAPSLCSVKATSCTDNVVGAGLLLSELFSPSRQPIARPALDRGTRDTLLACARAFSRAWKGFSTSKWTFNPLINKWCVPILI